MFINEVFIVDKLEFNQKYIFKKSNSFNMKKYLFFLILIISIILDSRIKVFSSSISNNIQKLYNMKNSKFHSNGKIQTNTLLLNIKSSIKIKNSNIFQNLFQKFSNQDSIKDIDQKLTNYECLNIHDKYMEVKIFFF